ncbi:hypothetical protein GCM10009841_07110 [Microlunatus panaciterrae]|uniref:Uncharacterized protein n=1 Tax=Microlunatus panaciterrae TaxID=400768 RepID=A0ABS2RI16_9ACTN|nr:hypothetical protein [Microlunatus panaciterrae]MBM7798636.1 hypothetical protein [Microlunatus panaciterrae]
MRNTKKSLRKVAVAIATTLLSSAGLMAATTTSAHAACPDDIRYSLRAVSTYVPFKGLPIYKDGKGGTMSLTRDFTKSASYQVTAGAETEAGAILAKAKVSISASLTKTNSSTVTHNYSHKISSNKYGHAQYVSWGKKVYWKKYRDTPTCTTQLIAKGAIKFPTNQEGWRYWETYS